MNFRSCSFRTTAGFTALRSASMLITPVTPAKFLVCARASRSLSPSVEPVRAIASNSSRAPSYASAHVALGATYLKLKDYSRAQQAFETAVKLNPDDSKAHYNLALLFSRLKNQDRAQQEMKIVENLRKTKSTASEEDLTPPTPR